MSLQGTPEWFSERCGYATASRFADVLARIRNGEAASRRNYRAQVVVERMTGVPTESYQSAEMRRGTEQEPYARMAYEAAAGAFVEEVGFIKHPTMKAGASPDGLVGIHGGLEIKCPNTAQHIGALLNGMDPEHVPQIQGQMWITGRQWIDFVSFDNRMPRHLQLYVQRIGRDQEYISKLEVEVRKFLAEVDALIERLSAIGVDTRKAA